MTRKVLAVLLLAHPATAQDDDAWLQNLAVLQLSPQEIDRRGIMLTQLGTIHLPSGRIVAVDPYTAFGLTPFDRRAPPGNYAVRLWFAATEPTRPALAELRLRACTPVFWHNAAPEGRSLLGLAPGEGYGVAVDAGTSSFAPPEFFETFGPVTDGVLQGDAYFSFVNETLFPLAFPDDTGIPRDFITQNGGQDIAVFSAGWGDGFYFSYWGFDDLGCPCALVTDFGVLEEGYPYDSTALRLPGPRARKAPPFAIWGRDAACVDG
ncbi:DUF4241 domain-containing protein [Tabrizicola aquatica]|uniref:DUF4241 domain-containing protein n=1 Tax=Tabrizicola aquatica TaxID=909926 RepID=UPI0011AF5974|nr:DUF4241 domain-containing protein [Tabrizicola aquatica]